MHVHLLKDRQTVRVNNGDYFILSTTIVQFSSFGRKTEREREVQLEKKTWRLISLCRSLKETITGHPWAIPVIYSSSVHGDSSPSILLLLLLANVVPTVFSTLQQLSNLANAKWNFLITDKHSSEWQEKSVPSFLSTQKELHSDKVPMELICKRKVYPCA